MEENIKLFLENKNTLIVDKSSTIRSSITQVLASLGQPKTKIFETSRFKDALELIEKNKPQIIFTEYFVDQHLGFELFQNVSLNVINEKERLYCMITANAEDYTIAQAAEEDIDAYIIKPFSKDDVTKYLHKCIYEKYQLTPFQQSLENIKVEIHQEKYQEAIAKLTQLVTDYSKSAIAYYYLGYCKQKINMLNESLIDFEKGLVLHPGHYKCLVGKFDSLEQLKKKEEAYEVIKYLANKYPINPDRIGAIVMLAVYTKNYEDINNYFSFYSQLETRPEKLNKIMTAGIYALGKFYVSQKKITEAMSPLRKCIFASGRSQEYLNKIVDLLISNNEPKAALEFLNMSSVDDQNKLAWKVLHFNTLCLFETPDRLLQKGKALTSEGFVHIDIVKKTTELLLAHSKKTHAENFVYSVINQLNEHRSILINLLEQHKP